MPSSLRNGVGAGGALGKYIDPNLIASAQGAVPTGLASSGPIAPDLAADETQSADSKPVRYLGRRIAGQPQAHMFDTGAQAVPPSSQVGEPLVGICGGQPMFPFPLPPLIWGRRDDTRAPDDHEEERSSRWLRLLSPQ